LSCLVPILPRLLSPGPQPHQAARRGLAAAAVAAQQAAPACRRRGGWCSSGMPSSMWCGWRGCSGSPGAFLQCREPVICLQPPFTRASPTPPTPNPSIPPNRAPPPRGNALLVGVGGSGKSSLARFAAFVAGVEFAAVEVGHGYGVASFREEVKRIYKVTDWLDWLGRGMFTR
jgi:hypothetical protein